MMINALNSGARVFMADFEDSCSPTWFNLVDGQANMKDAVRRTISLTTPDKEYRLNDRVATLLVRPRGWHLVERHATVDGEPMSGSLFDAGLYLFHNARELVGARQRAVPLPARSSRGAPRRRSGTTSWARARTCSACRAGRCGRRC